MLQLVYVSTAAKGVTHEDVSSILVQSRRSNARDAITGLLYFDGTRFLQALEGPEAAVQSALTRIANDPRHRAVVTLSRREIAARDFGEWAMAYRLKQQGASELTETIDSLVEFVSPSLRAIFEGFARVRAAH